MLVLNFLEKGLTIEWGTVIEHLIDRAQTTFVKVRNFMERVLVFA
jgi:hypothetical protein